METTQWTLLHTPVLAKLWRMRDVFLIRHCQSESNRDGILEGIGDSPLTELGVEQARRRARALADHGITSAALFASPRSRAATTAAEIAAHHGWVVTHDERFIEGDAGHLEGLTWVAAGEHFATHGPDHTGCDAHHGETLDLIGARMLAGVQDVLASSEGTVVIVTHGWAISALLHRWGHALEPVLANGEMVAVVLEDGSAVQPPTRHPLED